jgi:rhodanese-related sulfurtransferase
MNFFKRSIWVILIPTVFFWSSCKDKNVDDKVNKNNTSVNETEILLSFFEQTGNLINHEDMPFMVSVDDVHENLNKYLVIDIRNKEDYINGHIDGAINVEKKKLFSYMTDSVNASAFEKIVLVCYINHSASYAAMMLRLAGYGNVFSMRYGMSACDPAVAQNKWWKAISNQFAGILETKDNPKPEKGNLPQLNTGESRPYKILTKRLIYLFDRFNFVIDAKEVFQNPQNYFIICYWPADHYYKGHIPGAFQYTPKESLTQNAELSTLPIDKPIVVYDYTGQHASFVTAYLQILGYDAYTLHYGANSFMHDKLISLGIGNAYNKTEHFKPYPLVKGEKPSLKEEVINTVNNPGNENNSNPVVPVIKKKDKNKSTGGC